MTINEYHSRKIDCRSIVLILLLVIWVYWPACCGPFVYDDHETITKNPYVKNLGFLPGYFNPANVKAWSVHPKQQQYYRPLPLITFAINYQMAGLSPGVYRVTNILLHITVALLFLKLLHLTFQTLTSAPERDTDCRATFLFAVLAFALHPIQTESVTYIVSRSVVICSIFILAGLIAHLLSMQRQNGRVKWYLVAIGCFTLALFSKEVAIVFPLLLLSMVWSFARIHKYRQPMRFVMRQCLPFFGILSLYLAVRIVFLGQSTMSDIGNHFILYFMTSSKALFIYLRLIFLPIGQTLDHHLPLADSFGDPVGIAAAVAVVCIFIFVLKSLIRSPGFRSFWLAWFFLSILPNLVLPTNEAISEHSAYLPSIGLIATVAYTTAMAARKWWPFSNQIRRIVVVGVAIICLAQLSFLTVNRNLLWGNPLALWHDTVSKNPFSARAMNNLGTVYLQKNEILKARHYFLKAISLKPDSVEARNNLGMTYGLEGNHAMAFEMFQEALSMDPSHIESLNNLGFTYIRSQGYSKAIEILKHARSIAPDNPNIICNLGIAYLNIKEINKGCRLIRESIRINPDNPLTIHFLKNYCR